MSTPVLLAEAAPFLLLSEQEAVEAVAEFSVFLERPSEVRVAVLQPMLNLAFTLASKERYPSELVKVGLRAGMVCASWVDLMSEESHQAAERIASSENARDEHQPAEQDHDERVVNAFALLVTEALKHDSEVQQLIESSTLCTPSEAQVWVIASNSID